MKTLQSLDKARPKYLKGPPPRTLSQEVAHFWKQVKIGHPDACWEWQGCSRKGKYRYGWARLCGIQITAHKAAFLIAGGALDDGTFICHKCDNPSCVNPRHLFPGTNTINLLDRDAKGRTAKGEGSGTARLKAADILAIRAAYIPYKFGCKQVAAKFGISQQHATEIITRKAWKHLK